MTPTKFTLHILAQGPPIITYAAQGECNSRAFDIDVIDEDGRTIDLTGTTAVFYVDKGVGGTLQVNADVDGSTVHVTLPYQATTQAGDNHCWLQLLKAGGYDLRVDGLILRVQHCGIDDAIISSDEFGTLLQLIIDTNIAVAAAELAADNANAASDLAMDAASATEAAASKAETVTANAITATTAAQASTAAASAATGKASTATDQAAVAAINANNAAANANLTSGPLYAPVTLSGTAIQTAAVPAPLDDLKIYGKTTETVTGAKSPDNPSAITGVGGSGNVILAVHSKNHFDHKTNYGYTASSGTVSTLENGIKIVTTASVGKAYAISYVDGVPLEANKEYYCRFQVTISGSDGKIRGRIRVGQTDGALITYSPAPGAKDGVYNISFKFTSPSSGLINFQLNYQGEDTYALPVGIAIVWENIIISQTDIPYTPYIGNTYKIPLPTPLYSLPDGTRDVLERKDGQWGVTRRVGSATIDGVTYKAGWVGNEVNGVYQFNVGLPNKLFVNGKNAYSDKFIFVSVTSKDGEGFVGSNADLCLQISKARTGGVVSSAAATTWLQNNPVFALYSRTEAFEVLPQATQDILNSISTIGGDNIILNGDGAEMSVTVAGLFAHLQDGINKHKSDYNNPHKITAEQIGAAKSNHTHTAAQIGAAAVDHIHTASQLVEAINAGTSKIAPEIIGGTQKVLWSGQVYPDGVGVINLSENISAQRSGIILCWSSYNADTGEAYDGDWTTFFVPKLMVGTIGNIGLGCSMFERSTAMSKYLYIRDDSIRGHADNCINESFSGVNVYNLNYVLRYVIGI